MVPDPVGSDTYAYFENPTEPIQTAHPDFSHDFGSPLPTVARIAAGHYAVMRSHSSLMPLHTTPLVTSVGEENPNCRVLYADSEACTFDDGRECFVVNCDREASFMVRWVMSDQAIF